MKLSKNLLSKGLKNETKRINEKCVFGKMLGYADRIGVEDNYFLPVTNEQMIYSEERLIEAYKKSNLIWCDVVYEKGGHFTLIDSEKLPEGLSTSDLKQLYDITANNIVDYIYEDPEEENEN